MIKQLAPIVLFTYNRPWHMFQVLDALANNELAKESVLYIYCDGQKKESTKEEILMIEEVRGIAKNENRFKEVLVIEQEENRGLANSIITGVSEVINKHGSIIVLEDDIIPSVGFLKYMNDALALYEKEEKVGCIHAWNYNLDSSHYAESTFFFERSRLLGMGNLEEGLGFI
jgi:GT2 family glycosyltransferase